MTMNWVGNFTWKNRCMACFNQVFQFRAVKWDHCVVTLKLGHKLLHAIAKQHCIQHSV